MINEKQKTRTDAKIVFRYILENKSIIDSFDENFLVRYESDIPKSIIDNSKIIKEIYLVVKEFYKINNTLPSESIIYNSLQTKESDISFSIIKELYKNSDYEKYNKSELKNTIKLEYDFYIQHLTTLKYIENTRNKISNNNKIEIQNPFEEIENDDIPEKELDTINEYVYNNLPTFLKDSCNEFNNNDPKIKDVFLLSELTILSLLFNKIFGVYSERTSYSNLYCLISTESAGGKSNMNYAKDTLYIIEKNQRELNKQLLDSNNEAKEKYLRLAGDNSTAGFLSDLEQNEGIGLIYQTEIDTIISASKQDWGNYSDKLREAFHHDTIIQTRKGEKQKNRKIIIDVPKVSVLLSGTQDQVKNFIVSSQNGFFSRFIYYIFSANQKWESVFKKDINGKSINKEKIFKEIYGNKLNEIYEFYQNKDLEFTLTREQEIKFDNHFDSNFSKTLDYEGKGALSTIKRLGVISFRIMMILTALRQHESNLFINELVCSDIDFNIALKICDTLLQHGLVVYRNLSNENNIKFKVINDIESLYNEMNNVFTKNEIVKSGEKYEKMGIKKIETKLKLWIETGRIKKRNHFEYEKVRDQK